MGRQTCILKTNIYDDDEGEHPIIPKPKFIKELKQKYDLHDFCWVFENDGEITFSGKDDVRGEIENHVKALLDTAKEYKHKICGTFSYDDDKTGGSSHGIVYIAKNYTAKIYSFDTDINCDSLKELKNIIECDVLEI